MNIEKLIDIFAWVSWVCGIVSIICLTTAAIFNSYILAYITIIMLAICLLDFFVVTGLMLWVMSKW